MFEKSSANYFPEMMIFVTVEIFLTDVSAGAIRNAVAENLCK